MVLERRKHKELATHLVKLVGLQIALSRSISIKCNCFCNALEKLTLVFIKNIEEFL